MRSLIPGSVLFGSSTSSIRAPMEPGDLLKRGSVSEPTKLPWLLGSPNKMTADHGSDSRSGKLLIGGVTRLSRHSSRASPSRARGRLLRKSKVAGFEGEVEPGNPMLDANGISDIFGWLLRRGESWQAYALAGE